MNFRFTFLEALKRKLVGNSLIMERVGEQVFVQYDKLEVESDGKSISIALYQGKEKIIGSSRVAIDRTSPGQKFTVFLEGLEGRVLLLNE